MSSKKINIEGTAIVEGLSRNGIVYEAAELDKFAPTLTGRPILKDHEGLTDKTIGKITESKSINGGTSVSYKGWVKEDGTGIIEKIKDGRISEVSIGAMVGQLVKENADDTDFIARDMQAMEMSTTPVPGVQGTSVSQTGESYTEEVLQNMISESKLKSIKREEKRMTEKQEREDDKVDNEDNSDKESLVEAEEKLKIANEKIAALEKAQRTEAVKAYEKSCEAKKLKAVATESLTMETIKALTEQVEGVEDVKEDEAEDADDDKEDKEKAKSKTEEQSDDNKSEEKFNGYVIEQSSLGGSSFGKLN